MTTAEAIHSHLAALGARVTLTPAPDLKLEVDAPAGTLTPELVGLLAEHRAELVDLLCAETEADEREAIEWEACRYPPGVLVVGDPELIERAEREAGEALRGFFGLALGLLDRETHGPHASATFEIVRSEAMPA